MEEMNASQSQPVTAQTSLANAGSEPSGDRIVIQLQREAAWGKDWIVEWRATRYRALSYPDSDLIYLETSKGRPLSPFVARKMMPQLRAAISAVEGRS